MTSHVYSPVPRSRTAARVAVAVNFFVAVCFAQTCPPPGFGPVKAPFDPIKFIDSSPFYVQQQLVRMPKFAGDETSNHLSPIYRC